jgi:hypothetical protein
MRKHIEIQAILVKPERQPERHSKRKLRRWGKTGLWCPAALKAGTIRSSSIEAPI